MQFLFGHYHVILVCSLTCRSRLCDLTLEHLHQGYCSSVRGLLMGISWVLGDTTAKMKQLRVVYHY